ncbi:MAG: class I SAM-dependent methyltransferase [Phycisphaerales bacterium]|nr:class I SAM-dependent methyltransferase [Phycisphaerales bacterium]
MPSPTDIAWDDKLLANPHAAADKRLRVQRMFSAIAPSYDLNNRLHSFAQDQRWRKKAVKLAELTPDDVVVDVACGTGDLTLAFAHHFKQIRPAGGLSHQVIGIDFTYDMLPIAMNKWQRKFADPERNGRNDNNPRAAGATSITSAPASNSARRPSAAFFNGDAQSLPLPDRCCDVVSIAFGIRNVQEPAAALREFHRILRPGGRLIILEFSQPTNPLLRWCNDFYCTRIMPHTATWLSHDKTGAYKYLPVSVKTFISRQDMMDQMASAGFSSITHHPLTFGVCVCYRSVKPA